MRVKELINVLSQVDPEMPVIVDGYEGSYEDVKHVTGFMIRPDVNKSRYCGAHDVYDAEYDGNVKHLTVIRLHGGYDESIHGPSKFKR